MNEANTQSKPQKASQQSRLLLAIIGFFFVLLIIALVYCFFQKEQWPPSLSRPESALALKEAEFQNIFSNLLAADDLEIESEVIIRMDGCPLLFSAQARKKDGREYLATNLGFGDSLLDEDCQAAELAEEFAETHERNQDS